MEVMPTRLQGVYTMHPHGSAIIQKGQTEEDRQGMNVNTQTVSIKEGNQQRQSKENTKAMHYKTICRVYNIYVNMLTIAYR